MDLGPLLIALVSGGLLGSLVTTYFNARTTKQVRDDQAAEALWAYQAAVRGYSNGLFQKAGYAEEMAIPNRAGLNDVTIAQQAAIRFAGFLPEEARSLVRQPQFDFKEPWGDDEAGAVSSGEVADKLEKALDAAFSSKTRRRVKLLIRARRSLD
jgi:type II secretory pathway pseudopilin PulG